MPVRASLDAVTSLRKFVPSTELLGRVRADSPARPVEENMIRSNTTIFVRGLLLLSSSIPGIGLLAAEPGTTPAEVSIRKAQERIAAQPDHYPWYNALAMAYARRARETSDTAFYAKAEEVLKKSFEISPENFEGLKVKTWLSLGRHEFSKAREFAMTLNQRMPDDLTVYGYLADANAELGNYTDAVRAAQWMLDLRPGNVDG